MKRYRIAVVQWTAHDEIAEAIAAALVELGHEPVLFLNSDPIPAGVEIVFSFAPYGSLMALVKQLAGVPVDRRPILIHWNTEGIPDINLPWPLVYGVSWLRSSIASAAEEVAGRVGVAGKPPVTWFSSRMLRFRYVGDYYAAYRRGILNVFADSSVLYAGIHRSHGLPTAYLPWGFVPAWQADLNIPRDIDVVWLGKQGSRRRSQLLQAVRGQLRQRGTDVHMVDNLEHPFVFREDRTVLLNRAKITLNITRTWYDDNFSRFAMAAANRSLIVSEPMLPHCPEFVAGVHYVSAPVDRLGEVIRYYLDHEEERQAITDAAYQMVRRELTLARSVAKVLDQADALCRRRDAVEELV